LRKKALRELTRENISSLYNPFPKETHSSNSSIMRFKRHVSLKQIFVNLQEPKETADPDQVAYSNCRWYGKHCQGNSEVNINSIGPTIRAEHHGNIEFLRVRVAIVEEVQKKVVAVLTEGLLQSPNYVGNRMKYLLQYNTKDKLFGFSCRDFIYVGNIPRNRDIKLKPINIWAKPSKLTDRTTGL